MPDGITADWKRTRPISALRVASEGLQPLDIEPTPLQGSVASGGIVARSFGRSSHVFHLAADAEDLKSRLFRNRASLKLITAQVAMHFSGDERKSLFAAIDRLLDEENWEDESSEINVDTFRTYLRFLIFTRPRRRASYGVSPDGSLLASWHRNEKSVYVEFLPQDKARVIIKLVSDRGPETLAWQGHVARLREFITRNGVVECID